LNPIRVLLERHALSSRARHAIEIVSAVAIVSSNLVMRHKAFREILVKRHR
jgi:hypothetical protein